jgi:hypothetical protein
MELTKETVAQKVRERLKNVSVTGITMEVGDENIHKVDNWWRVPIRPSRWPKRMFEFYEVLAEVENDLQEKEHLDVLLFTGDPLEEEEEVEAMVA